MYLLEVEKNTGFSGSRKVNSSRGEYGHDYSVKDQVCQRGSCEGCSEKYCFWPCSLVFKGKKGTDKLLYHGRGKGKCVENFCQKKEDCKNQGHSGFDCDVDEYGQGYCYSDCSHFACHACAETQCKELDWSCDWKENKCVHKPECKKDADCLTLATHENLCYQDCAEGDIFCNKEEGKCERVACDPANMGGCEGCSINQCQMADQEDCLVVPGRSEEEYKCVSNTCANSDDCRKLFGNDSMYQCLNGKCGNGDE